jgi:ketosteroid isomerase-like protein
MGEPAPHAELIRDGFAAFSERRFSDCLATMHPEIEWHIAFRLPDLPPGRTVARGHDEVLELWQRFTSVWDRLIFAPEEILYDEGDTAIVRIHVIGTGGESGIEVDRTVYYLMTIEGEQLRRIEPYDSPEDARAAAGLGQG